MDRLDKIDIAIAVANILLQAIPLLIGIACLVYSYVLRENEILSTIWLVTAILIFVLKVL